MNCRTLALTVLGLIASSGFVRATTAAGESGIRRWSVFPHSSYWSDAENWEPNAPPDPGDDLEFSLSYFVEPMIHDLAPGIFIRSITFDFNGYTLKGNPITLGSMSCTHGGAQTLNTIKIPIAAAGPLPLSAATGCSLDFIGEISGAGHPVVGGQGPVVLSGLHSYTGPTETALTGGSLVVNGTLSGTSGVTIQASSGTSTLRGSGSFGAPLVVGASSPNAFVVVEPGDETGTGVLSAGPASFGLNASLVVRLNGPAAGTQHDQLHVTGGVDLGTSTTLTVSLGFAPAEGQTFTILRNDSATAIAGAFAGLPEGGQFLVGGTTLQISYLGDDGNDVVLTVVPTLAAPAALAVDPSGNGILEPGELAVLQPVWTNTSGAMMHLSGATALFDGPIGANYSNPDAIGDYGTVPDGDSAPCTDCYAIQVQPITGRPVLHWDATIDETVGLVAKTWTLHIGESFSDVDASQPFYPFIENLFHNGVTGGCGGGAFCPDDPVTRGSMAVFLLKGEHTSSYVPPVCTATVFTDVPCPGGPFVDWVNRLASEGITAGCGGGRYCPNDSVSRGQMAVFLLKGEHGGSYAPPACTRTVFSDVPCPDAQFVDWINQLMSEAITGGCGGDRYCPDDPVARGQMAVFLVKTFGLALYGL
jgi:hypothetical protein